MIFSKEYVRYLGRELVKKLVATEMIETKNQQLVAERIANNLTEELSLEDRINDEVRLILDAYSEEMRMSGASYQEMFKKVKLQLVQKYKAVL
ncbi:MAG: DUF507 family protein [Acidobacteriaceae bacterium]